MKPIATLLLLSLFTFSCTHRPEPELHREVVYTVKTDLTLNLGERWEADKATNQNMYMMQRLMHLHLLQPDVNTPEANQVLSKTLQGELKNVFATCTMHGPAHDMLHAYLTPIVEDVRLLEAKELKGALAARDRISTQLKAYNQYFK
ncbi:hypothetical protein FVR03_19520 [Pontibacter qinzhouensis]|uniref:Uncharacterized protein n=1 Tax=Pontibacter qinzhouensis TaxID=2603253 RepID=A0A5C8J753_9BACT|nr:hypothetical protein [Pontibacter qinzhouensis]TXK32807.1 hypothetical protein FVR03_19520 [Pontibacter qinzhouensis]